MQTIKPTADNIFAKPDETVKQTKSGFLLGEGAVEQPKIAEVINIGGKVTSLKSGDRIIYKSYSTTDIKLDDQDYILMKEEDVVGVVVEVKDEPKA
jgi:chaperonin GroES